MDDLIENAAQKLRRMSESERAAYLATAPDDTKHLLLACMRTIQQDLLDQHDLGSMPPAGSS